MIKRFFDFEVFPHWWCVVYGDLPEDYEQFDEVPEQIKDTFKVITSNDEGARDKLVKIFREPNYVMVGFNIKHYDLAIANAIYQGFNPEQVKIINDLIINKSLQYSSKEHMRLFPFTKKKIQCVYQDLFDDNDGSLKEKEAILGLDIRETTVPFDQEVLDDNDIAEIIYYCKHDVYASMYYYLKVMKGYVKNKLVLGKKFNIPEDVCYMSTNANLVGKALGARRMSHSDEERLDIEMPKKVRKYCEDNLPFGIYDYIRYHSEKLDCTLFRNKVVFGNGGIHSVYDNNLYVEENDEYTLMNKDASSYYPSMLIQFDCLSRNVVNPSVFKNIYDERIYLKHKPDKTQEEEDSQLANKLVLNTTFGASGNKYLELYDPYQCTKCCRAGQIFLAALACKLVKTVPNLNVIQSNTDGLLLYFPRKYLDLVTELGQEWSDLSGIMMEDDHVTKIWQRDVNNYLLVKEKNGKISPKRKGMWLMDTWTKPGYFLISPLTAYVCQRSVIDYLIYSNDIIESIINNDNLLDFAITCKKGPTYRGVIQRFADGHEEELFKCNRVIATKDTYYGKLYKTKMNKGSLSYTSMPSTPEHCMTINKALYDYDFDEIRKTLDYSYYVQRAIDLLDGDWKQLDGNQLLDYDMEYKI